MSADIETVSRILATLNSIPGTQWSMRDETTFVLDVITDRDAFDTWKIHDMHIDPSKLDALSAQ